MYFFPFCCIKSRTHVCKSHTLKCRNGQYYAPLYSLVMKNAATAFPVSVSVTLIPEFAGNPCTDIFHFYWGAGSSVWADSFTYQSWALLWFFVASDLSIFFLSKTMFTLQIHAVPAPRSWVMSHLSRQKSVTFSLFFSYCFNKRSTVQCWWPTYTDRNRAVGICGGVTQESEPNYL